MHVVPLGLSDPVILDRHVTPKFTKGEKMSVCSIVRSGLRVGARPRDSWWRSSSPLTSSPSSRIGVCSGL
jgi:hypothetical protein